MNDLKDLVMIEKLTSIEKRLETIEAHLKIVNASCETMENHIVFVNGVYSTLRAPLNFILGRFTRSGLISDDGYKRLPEPSLGAKELELD
jgi:hypothetical protein